MQKPKLLIIDFDGTALGGHEPYAEFPPLFVAFLNGLGERGVAWATNTTWAPEEQWAVMQKSGVRNLPVYLTGQTGRALARVEHGRVVRDADHEQTVAKRDAAFRSRVWPQVRELFAALLRDDLVTRLAFDFYVGQCLIDFTCREGCEDRVWALVQPLLTGGDYYAFNPANRTTAVLLPFYMNKGHIVRVLHERLGMTPAETIVAGDAVNDLHMLNPALAGWMVCPANAEPAVVERVRAHGGFVSVEPYSWGVIDGVNRILARFTG